MKTHTKAQVWGPLFVAAAAFAGGVSPALADSPPPSWTKVRVLSCDGGQVVTAVTPAGFGSPYHVVDSSDVIVPKHVEVVFPGEVTPVTTLDVPGFDQNARSTVHCSYTDPGGLAVDLIGIRS